MAKARTLSMALSLILAAGSLGTIAYGAPGDDWQSSFNIEECTLSPNGANDFFVLEPGYQLVLEGDDEGEEKVLIITVLDETKTVDGTETRIVEERETADGELVEISMNFFAICEETGDIFYFGEQVDNYEDGEIINHDGSWEAGADDATPGIIVPADPQVGMKYYQEVAPGVAEDRAEILSISEVLDTPAGEFENVLKVEETTPLEPDVKEYKFHAPGVGLIQDGPLKLTKYMLPKDGSSDSTDDNQMQKRKATVAKETGEQIHQKHMMANPASRGEYAPGTNYTVEAAGTGNGSEVALAINLSVWRSNSAVIVMDIVGGSVTVGDETYDVHAGYALYSIQNNVIRAGALAVTGSGDVVVLKLHGISTGDIKLAQTTDGEPVELTFDGSNRNSLDKLTLDLDGAIHPS